MFRASRPACAALSAALFLAGCSPRQGGRAPEATTAHAEAGPVVPATAPEIQALAARPGARATLVNVWATWCAPCREEFPGLLRVSRARARDGLRLVLVSADFEEQLPAVRSFLAGRGVTDTTYLKTGDDMPFINTMSPDWSGALPATFVYDAHGRLVRFWEGMADEARFSSAVNEALGTPTP
ncbi:MAG TPA: TlpA disulfide reductase family protein [Candidatus Eisenbacteria bacterium]